MAFASQIGAFKVGHDPSDVHLFRNVTSPDANGPINVHFDNFKWSSAWLGHLPNNTRLTQEDFIPDLIIVGEPRIILALITLIYHLLFLQVYLGPVSLKLYG
jgi:hypothetical protein